jgi:hypothetical protein
VETRVSGAYQVKKTVNEVHVELAGSLDERLAADVEREVLSVVTPLPPGQFAVVFQTAKLSDCSMGARPVLVRLQQALSNRVRRTAYLDDRPRFRGLALWVVHVAEDRNAKAVATPEQLRQWLDSSVGRVEDAQARAEGRP